MSTHDCGIPRFDPSSPVPFQQLQTGEWVRWDDMVELIKHCLDVGSGSPIMHKIANAFEDTLGVPIDPSDI